MIIQISPHCSLSVEKSREKVGTEKQCAWTEVGKNSPVQPASGQSYYRDSKNPSDSRQAASMARVVVATPLFSV